MSSAAGAAACVLASIALPALASDDALASQGAASHPGRARPGTVDEERRTLAAAAFDEWLRRQARLLSISAQLRRDGLALCGSQRSPLFGLLAGTSADLPLAFREVARERFGVDERVRVLWVWPEGPAARAGIRAGDLVNSIDGQDLRNPASLAQMLGGAPGRPLLFEVEREGQLLLVDVEYVGACFDAALLAVSDSVNAFAAEGRIVVTTGMLRFADDDELALVLGHEIAHRVLGHPRSRPSYEIDADLLGAYLAARAGFDVSKAPGLWWRLGVEHPFSLSNSIANSHPGSPERALSLDAAVHEIRGKQRAGEPLVPGGAE